MRSGNHLTSVSALLGARVSDADGKTVGHVHELVVSPSVDAKYVFAFLLRTPSSGKGGKLSLLPTNELEPLNVGTLHLRAHGEPTPAPDDSPFLLMDRDVLDQQIIDVHGHKVVRVNDVELVWEALPDSSIEPGAGNGVGANGSDSPRLALRIAEVEVGMRGAVRRLLKGLPSGTVDRIAARFRTSVIPWDFVDLIDRDPARRLKLKIEQDRLAKMHPSDLADILEELAPAERQALFTSLDEEVAAEALEEVEPKMQKALTESLDSERMAGIVEEMDPAAAADFLAELPDERSEAILGEMNPEERQEVEELLEFPENSAAGQMTTDYISLSENATFADAISALREFEGDVEEQTHIFLVNEEDELKGAVPMVKLLLGGEGAVLAALSDGHVVFCDVNANGKKVAELFDKYNLRALPVIDAHKKLAGVIYPEQVITQLRSKN
jgi:magnesium transporter